MAHYFEIQTDRDIPHEFRKATKSQHKVLLPLVRKISKDSYESIGLNFLLQGHPVDANAFVGEVLRMEEIRLAREARREDQNRLRKSKPLSEVVKNRKNLGPFWESI